MKKALFFIGILLSFSNLMSQEKISGTYSTSNINEISIELKFAKKIEIKKAENNEVLIEATININENKDNHHFSLKSNKKGDKLTIDSDYGNYFKDQKNNIIISNKDNCVNCEDQKLITMNYVLYIPSNKKLKIKSISGDVEAEDYNGLLNLDLISGDITIKNHSKEMLLKTISGDIDVYLSDATFKAKTLTGTIYSNLDIDFNNQKKQIAESKITGTVKQGTASLKMETISGNVYLRKI